MRKNETVAGERRQVNSKSKGIRKATEQDIPAIVRLENQCFQTPWSEKSIREDMTKNDLSVYIVCEADDEIVGYAGIWFIAGEGHINNVCVSPSHRCKGFGQELVLGLIGIAEEHGVFDMTLEVRKSNDPAIKLYEKNGFNEAGIRPGYYQDNGEDAVIMWRENEG